MKKLLIIHDSMGGGGAERVLITLLQALDPVKYDVTLLLIYKEGPFFNSIPKWVKVKWLFTSYASVESKLITHFAWTRNAERRRRAVKLLGDTRFDVTVSFMEGPAAKLHSQLMNYSPVNISWVHCNMRVGRWYKFWFGEDEERDFYHSVDKVAFVSHELLEEFEKIHKVKAEKRVIYNPVVESFLNAKAAELSVRKENVFRIINCGRLVWQKNHHLLIEVADELRSRGLNFRIDVLGSGPMYDELIKEVKSRGLSEHIVFRGFADNPFPDMKSADLFCMTSSSEGCPMVIAESMMLGTPVVSTPIKAVGEMLANGGGLISDGSAKDIADKIEYLINNPDDLRRLGEEARQGASMFEVSAIVKEIEDFISE